MLERMQCGQVPDKHHIAMQSPQGQLRWEECLTRQGFDGPYTILYREHEPHLQNPARVGEGWDSPAAASRTTPPLLRRHFQAAQLPAHSGGPIESRTPLLHNEDVVLSVVKPTLNDARYFSNADGDDLYFILEGGGTVRSPMGDLRFSAHDYVFVPRGVAHRMILDEGPQFWLSIECQGGLSVPQQWRNEVGQLRMDAPYCHRDFGRPVFEGPRDEGLRELLIKRGGQFHGFELANNPLDVVGWDGTVYPWTFPILAFQPRVGMVHLPPSWHGTFAARGALICSFVPRPVDFHRDAIPCPYPHSSVDVDEVLFYCSGDFTSREGVGPGSLSLHPAGVPHGPHAGAYERSRGTTRTNEMAVMLDCARPLYPTAAAHEIEDAAYHRSFGHSPAR